MSARSRDPVRTAVLISGRGSNMEALLSAAREPAYPAQIMTVIANRADAAGLKTAQAAGVHALALPHKLYKDREAHERGVHGVLLEMGIELVALAGYMRVLTPWFVSRWRGRMLNIHPSLLPLYPGLHTHERAIAAADAEAGCSVHLVSEGVDDGPVLGQARVPVLPSDTAKTLAARVLEAEHRLYPAVLANYARALRSGATAAQ